MEDFGPGWRSRCRVGPAKRRRIPLGQIVSSDPLNLMEIMRTEDHLPSLAGSLPGTEQRGGLAQRPFKHAAHSAGRPRDALRDLPRDPLRGLPRDLPRLARLALALLRRARHGRLRLITPEGHRLDFGIEDPRFLDAVLHLKTWLVFDRALRRGDVGFGESWMDDDWDSPDLPALLRFMLRHRSELDRGIYGTWLGQWLDRLRHWLHKNNRKGSRRNIAAHYDLGNDFYRLWLDPSMTYSSALRDRSDRGDWGDRSDRSDRGDRGDWGDWGDWVDARDQSEARTQSNPGGQSARLAGSRSGIARARTDPAPPQLGVAVRRSCALEQEAQQTDVPRAGEVSETALLEAQHRKYDRILDVLGLERGAQILEIGCGWGGFAERARGRGLHVKALTLSAEQLAYCEQRHAGLEAPGQATFALQDYRDERGSFDAVVSIEMFEAVGERYWGTYFARIADRLKPGGQALVQSITIDERYFLRYRASTDFIQQYIFPGGMLPSAERLVAVARRSGLLLRDRLGFGADYAWTLGLWRKRFLAREQEVQALGYNRRFRRMWDFYLAYCQAGFEEGATDVIQFRLQKTAPSS